MSSVQRSSRMSTGVGDPDGAEALVEGGVPWVVHAVEASTSERIAPSVRRLIRVALPGVRYYEAVAHTTSP